MDSTTPLEDRNQDAPSGRFVLRIGPELHGRMRDDARRLDVSLNEYCSRLLSAPGSAAHLPLAEVVEGVHARFGRRLIGVLVHGSWAAGELADTSDLDLLVVVSSDVDIDRKLYRAWDHEVIRWDSRVVERHIVHLPPEGREITGTWAEAAVNGIVLLDPTLAISRRLIEIRRRVGAGEVVRRLVRGQPYWVRTA